MKKLLVEVMAPAALAAALQIAERWGGLFVLLPVTPAITKEWGALAFLLGVACAAVTGPYFSEPHREFGLGCLVLHVAVILASLVPFIAPRLDVRPEWLPVLVRFAYLVFHAAIGALIGGAWSWCLKKSREAAAYSGPRYPERP